MMKVHQQNEFSNTKKKIRIFLPIKILMTIHISIMSFVNIFCWVVFIFGILFNGLMIRLIICHTPLPMRIYSKILLQTCLTDILFLIMTLLLIPYNFVTAKGETEAILYGLVSIKGVENRFWNVLAFVCWVFLVYVSMFGYVAQFIFRYFVLVREKNISTLNYFLILFLMLLFPFAYCVNLFICYYPPADHALMDDNSVAEILGINLDNQQIVLAGYSYNDFRQSVGLYYIITVCTFAYIIMFCLAFLMHKFLDKKAKNTFSSAVAKKMIEMNKQVSRNLIIQASMPLLIYFSVLFFLALILFKINVNRWNWLQYYNLTSSIPQFLPSAFNPLVSIWALRYYRRAVVADFKCFVVRVKTLLFSRHSSTEKEQKQQQQQPDKWAFYVPHASKQLSKQ